MAHTTKILTVKKLSDGEFSVLIQCCGDEKHTSWATMHASVAADAAKKEALISAHRQRVADLHDHALKAEVEIQKLIGVEVEHS